MILPGMRLRTFAVGNPSQLQFKVGGFARAKYAEISLPNRVVPGGGGGRISGRPVVADRAYKISQLGARDGQLTLTIYWPDGPHEYPRRAFLPVL